MALPTQHTPLGAPPQCKLSALSVLHTSKQTLDRFVPVPKFVALRVPYGNIELTDLANGENEAFDVFSQSFTARSHRSPPTRPDTLDTDVSKHQILLQVTTVSRSLYASSAWWDFVGQ